MKKISLNTLSLIGILFCCNSLLADTYPKREIRSTWLATVWAIDWPNSAKATTASGVASQKAELDAMLDGLKESGFNAVSFQVRSLCDAMYKSSYEPWSVQLTGTRGKTPYNNFDPLAYCVEQAHLRGMECHAWVNPFRFSSGTGASYTTTQDNYYRDNGMLMTNTVTNSSGESSTGTILNPALSSVRQRITDICAELATNYDIDGIMFDDYFYSPNYMPENSSMSDWSDYQSYVKTGGTLTMGDWRRDNINKTLKQVYDKLQTIKNGTVRFGLGPAGIGGGNGGDGANPHSDIPSLDSYDIKTDDWQYKGIYSDPVAWIKGGYIDYITPQVYWVTTQANHPYGPLCKWWSDVAHQFNRHCYISQSLEAIASANNSGTWSERAEQVRLNRQYNRDNAPGSIYYSAKFINSSQYTGLGDHLKANVYQYQSLPPEITWKSLDDPGKVANLQRSGTTLSWSSLGSDMRYTVYAIPLSTAPKDAASTIHDGYKAEYLLGFTYSNSYTLPSSMTSGYWYAVAPFDGFCKEWEATTLNAPATDPVNVSLVSPENAAQANIASQTFTWTGDANAIYTFEISDNSAFSSIIYSAETKETSVTYNMGSLNDATTYYWRVTAAKNGYITTTTSAWSFKTPTRPTVAVALTAPANGNEVERGKCIFSWTGDEGATYTFELGTDKNFGSTAVKQTTTENSYTFDITTLNPLTTYYWRVIGAIDGYKNGTSETWSFTTPDIPTWWVPEIYQPASGALVNDDMSFVVSDTYAETTHIEISTTQDFIDLYYSGAARWVQVEDTETESGMWLQYTMPISYFTNGDYYWRVRVTKGGYKDGYTEIRTFKVTGQADGSNTYSMVRENHEYELPNVESTLVTLTNIWIRSDLHGNGLGQESIGTNNRGFCARKTDNTLYVSGRSGSSAYLDLYNAATGEYKKRLNLSGTNGTTISSSTSACNSVDLDNEDNLYIYNAVAWGASPIQICSVDPTTGYATEEVSITNPGVRIDHCDVVGDVTSNYFYVFAASKANNIVYRWTVQNGSASTPETMSISSFYPATDSDGNTIKVPGTAPRVIAIDESTFYLDGSGISFTLYEWGNGTPIGSFAQNESIAPKNNQCNGGRHFTHDGVPYIIYPIEDYENIEIGYKFYVASGMNLPGSFSGLTKHWAIPHEAIGCGKNTGGDYSALADVIQHTSNTLTRAATPDVTNIYLYVPGNGIAAYTMRSRITTDVDGIPTEKIKITNNNGIISFGTIVEEAALYTMSGSVIALGHETTCIESPMTSGIYLLQIKNNGTTITEKIIIK